ncbi:FtsX-like permease family protein [uncultured Psychrobacillus sp.]|uniref:FtsX-like permease family protein n=1 Tax=uncultured Psychrobacillus sp. TaxID=1551585 RepID=UPI002628E139|nr:FtsX-like permease family protein [uncultured Psychrobacillus sp.]
MMLCKLSLKNITKSMKDYAIYFFTLILGVAIFYVFNAIDSQTVMFKVSGRTYEIIKLMTSILSAISVFVSFILGFLIIYASRFLIKRRNKEFAIYLTLGMSKRKISLILFFETLLIGLISLIIGLGLGVFLSQLMSVLVANMFEADMTKFQFVFSQSACLKTLIYFGIMYLIVIIFNTIIINKYKLIDLLSSSKKSEKVKLKNPYVCIVIFIISVIVLGLAYYLVTDGFEKLTTADQILIPIIMGIVSTFTLFWSMSGLILKLVMSLKNIYYKGLNSFIVRQISSKINTMVFSMTIICLMLFVTICVLSSSLSLKNSMTKNLKELVPMDIEFTKPVNREEGNGFSEIEANDSKISIEKTLENLNLNPEEEFKDTLSFNIYEDESIILKSLLINSLDEIYKEYPFLLYNQTIDLMKLNDYNALAEKFNLEKYNLKENEYIVIVNYDYMASIINTGLKNNPELLLNNETYHSKYKKCQDGFYELNSSRSNTGFIVLPDKALENHTSIAEFLVANYKNDKEKTEDKIDEVLSNNYNKTTWLTYNSKIDIAKASVGLGSLVTFVGLYLGIIFLISSAAILALKELSESTDNKERYNMLRKIGASEEMLNSALFKQIGIFFATPLLLAIIHSIFGIKFANFLLESMGTKGLLLSNIMTAIFLVTIYGGYFILTYLCSKNIISKRTN